jgi:hypothetical protein
MPSEKIKHLELIQAVVTRMNSNSFQMKGWMVADRIGAAGSVCKHPER